MGQDITCGRRSAVYPCFDIRVRGRRAIGLLTPELPSASGTLLTIRTHTHTRIH